MTNKKRGDKMTIEMICNNKGVIVRHKTKWYLFSYGTPIMSWDYRTNKLWRHFKNSELVSNTTSRHIHEFLDQIPKYFEYKNIKQFVMNLNYKEVA